ncbi:hypothetical protein L3X38_007741 [Prunus dulcis]|uniref:Uncharacterized protein n=1 Tax=Prunus dulcis TaxID=3755 RepID=A0AAD4ZVJ6_PRUDU|nr:hypothetical protein L3X38_007741 [Prunus dulcis]
MTEIKNNTAVEVEIREVERGDVSVGRLVAKMPPAGRNLIRAKKFLDHSSYTGVPRTVHVIATANGTRTTTVLSAQYFNTNGRVTFLLENGKLVAEAETIPPKSIIMRGIGRFSHSTRNCVADSLAKASYNGELGVCPLDSAPAWIGTLLADDVMGVSKTRWICFDNS